jgi:phosphate transport system substrate-binding protein
VSRSSTNRLFTMGVWRLLVGLVALSLIAFVAFGCSSDDDDEEPTPAEQMTEEPGDGGVSGSLSIEGSSTVQPFTIEAIPAFEDENPDASINPPSGLGSGAGITAFINKEVDVAQASRAIKEDEIQQAMDAGLDPFETRIFNDALAIVVHPDNPIESLTVEQVAMIFAGEISNFSEVGGDDTSITAYTRNEESGTFAYMEEDVIQATLGDESGYGPDINKQANAPAGLAAVSNDTSGIFYAGLGNLAEVPEGSVKVLLIATDGSATAVAPSADTVADGSYPIARGLFYYSDGDPATSDNPVLTAFIEFVLGPEGQAIGEALGFLPVGPTS